MAKTRMITTNYLTGGRSSIVKKTVKSVHAHKAVPNAVYHMSQNHYEAGVAEVYDEETAELHAVITHSANGSIHVVFQRDPVVPVCLVLPLKRSKK